MKRRFKVIRLGDKPFAPQSLVTEEQKEIEAAGGELVPVLPTKQESELIELVRDADGLTRGGGSNFITRPIIEAMPKCRGIVTISIGFDNVDVVAAAQHGIPVANVRGFCIEEVAHHAIMFMLALSKKLITLNNYIRGGKWDISLLYDIPRLSGKTLGLVAYGAIAREVARIATCFKMKVMAYDPFVDENDIRAQGVLPVTLEEIFRKSDFVSVHCPITNETHHLIGEREFGLMKPSAFFINTARGAVVDEKVLIEVLKRRSIAGAGLDVFEKEPIFQDNPLLKMDNVILTSHTASYSEESVRQSCIEGAQQMAQMLQGNWPTNLVNFEVKKKSRFPYK